VNAAARTLGLGALTDRVALQRRVDTPEAEGGATHTFVPVSSLWARVRSLSARTLAAGDGRVAGASHSVVLRFRSDITAGDRFGYRGRWLDVVGTTDLDGRRTWLNCHCAEREMVG
jgi:SPP1 family predicted phage head-tail adaptor